MITFPVNGKNHLAQILKTFNFKPNKDKEYSADKFSLAADNQNGFIGFHELDIEYIKSIILQIMLDITEVTIIDTETETNTIINLKEQKETMLDLTEYKYEIYFDFRSEHAYKRLNRTLGYKLKNNTDEYICEKFRLNLKNNFGFVYFKELDRSFIKDTMKKILSALDETVYYWDGKSYCDIRNETEDEDKDEEQDEEKDEEQDEEQDEDEKEYKNTITIFDKTFKYNTLITKESHGNRVILKFIDCYIINSNKKVELIDYDMFCEDISIKE
jgi:hypothetical protein